jgi:hypothetical protein
VSTQQAGAARDRIPETSVEIGFERMWATVPWEPALSTGLLINYYPSQYVYFGTSQSSLTWKSVSEYRPDFHIGVIFPFIEHLSLETTVGMDFFTALIIALAILDEDDSIRYHQFKGSFYSPYFTLATALRIDYDMFALKLISQVQFGGYYLSETSTFNASVWLGLGTTVRFAI